MMSNLLWSFLVFTLLIMMDQTEGWRRRRRRRCPVTNCVVSSWTSWSNCTQPCGTGGTQTRTRKVTRPASCGGSCPARSQTKACNRGCPNGGTPIHGRCNCKPGYSGRCCTGECSNYRFLNESNRAKTYNKPSPYICDSRLSGCRVGTDSAERQEVKCQSRVSKSDIAARMRQAGWTEVIQQWLMGL
ncbi:uncharacterized protein LOC144643850 [Oculina patagonica]